MIRASILSAVLLGTLVFSLGQIRPSDPHGLDEPAVVPDSASLEADAGGGDSLQAGPGIVIPGADGSDGAFSFLGDLPPGDPNVMTIDLRTAPTGLWDDPGGDVNGDSIADGIYDPQRWAVVFKYTSVVIPTGKRVKFLNHRANAPVVWLVSGNVNIAGDLDLDGQGGVGPDTAQSEPGPGGFRGGRAHVSAVSLGSGGFGPGGGGYTGTGGLHSQGGTHATKGQSLTQPIPDYRVYGDAQLIPLIGGSGGSSSGTPNPVIPTENYNAGAGGGAILIASSGVITIGYWLHAAGGFGFAAGAGSGGSIRLVADRIDGGGTIDARGGVNSPVGGSGRIRTEANEFAFTGGLIPAQPPGYSHVTGITEVILWPDVDAPRIRCTRIAEHNIPSDPYSEFDHHSNVDVSLSQPGSVTLAIEAENVPVPPDPLPWQVVVRVVPKSGYSQEVFATFVSGDLALSQWEAQVSVSGGFATVQARAFKP